MHVKFGERSLKITSAHWSSAEHVGLVVYLDDGKRFVAEALGLSDDEQRQAVSDDAARRISEEARQERERCRTETLELAEECARGLEAAATVSDRAYAGADNPQDQVVCETQAETYRHSASVVRRVFGTLRMPLPGDGEVAR